MACIHAPNGAGICWPGGKTGYNEVRSESTQVDHLSRSSRILTCLVCLVSPCSLSCKCNAWPAAHYTQGAGHAWRKS